MPERKPGSQRLSYIDHQDRHSPAITGEPDHHRGIEDRSEFLSLQDIDEESREERSGAQRDDTQIEKDPQAKGKPVIHVGLIQAAIKAKSSRIDSEGQHGRPWREP